MGAPQAIRASGYFPASKATQEHLRPCQDTSLRSHPLPVAWLSHSCRYSWWGLGGVSGGGASQCLCKAACSFLEPGASAEPEPGNKPPKGPGPPGPQNTPGHAWQAHESVGGRSWGRGCWAQGGEAESGGKQAPRPRVAAVWGSSLPTHANRAQQGPPWSQRDEAAPAPSQGLGQALLTCHELGLPVVCTMEEEEEGALGPGRGCELLRGLG